MLQIQRTLKVFLFIAASMLVLNDCARLAFSMAGININSKVFLTENEEESNPINAFSLFEEEVKHSNVYPAFSFSGLTAVGLDAAIVHLIKDDEVKHLAYLAIFSPPPDLV